MGHEVIGVDQDATLLDHARRSYPGVRYVLADLLDVSPQLLRDNGISRPCDLVVVPGNVMVFLAPGSEGAVLAALASVLAPGGRLVAGFRTDRPDFLEGAVSLEEYDGHAAAAGLTLEQRFATWHLDPWHEASDWL